MKRLTWVAASLMLVLASGAATAQDKDKDKDKNEDRPRPTRRGGRARGGSRGSDSAPKVGKAAPAFKLKSLDGKQEFELAGFKGKKPVVLFFGSYT